MQNFVPAWFLPGPHLQTIWGRIARPRRVQFWREVLNTPDGDDLVLDHLDGHSNLHFVLLHGLEGSSYSVCLQRILGTLSQLGHHATAMNFRTCARDPEHTFRTLPNKRPRFYHLGDSADLDLTLRTLAARHPERRFLAFGASLGGNVLLKWLGENPDQQIAAAGATLSVPYDLAAGVAHLDATAAGRLYVNQFLLTLKRKCRRPDIAARIDVELMQHASNFREFDEAATAPLHGFANADDYYEQCGSIAYVDRIRTPTLALSAEDDPFQPIDVLHRVRANVSRAVDFRTTPVGGHVGFVGGNSPWEAKYWGEELIVRWLLEQAAVH